MGKFKFLVLVLVLVLALLPTVASAQAIGSRPALVSVDSYTVRVGQEFTVPVRVSGVSNLYAYDVRLPHDRAILQGVRVDHGGWLIPGFVIRQGFYEWAGPGCGGYCAWYAMTQLRPALPVSGSGVLINVVYRAVAPGVVTLQPWAQLSAAGGIPIPAATRGGTVTDATLSLSGYEALALVVKRTARQDDDEALLYLRSDDGLVRIAGAAPADAANGTLTSTATSFTALVAIAETVGIAAAKYAWWLKGFDTTPAPDEGLTLAVGTFTVADPGLRAIA